MPYPSLLHPEPLPLRQSAADQYPHRSCDQTQLCLSLCRVSEKAEESEIKLPIPVDSSKKPESSRKNIYFHFIDSAKGFDCVDHNKQWEILEEMGISDHMTCILRNLYAGQEATVRTGHGTTD